MIYELTDYVTYSILRRGGVRLGNVIMSQEHPPYVRGQGVTDDSDPWFVPGWARKLLGWRGKPLEVKESEG